MRLVEKINFIQTACTAGDLIKIVGLNEFYYTPGSY
jgi:hypothetical protein